ncbi:MAG: hypothetical protein ACYCXO_13575 [Candidatus Humimicrobiaceae bacterium]
MLKVIFFSIFNHPDKIEFRRDRPPPKKLAVADSFDDYAQDDYIDNDYRDF